MLVYQLREVREDHATLLRRLARLEEERKRERGQRKKKHAKESSKGTNRPQHYGKDDNTSQDTDAYEANPSRKRRATGTH